MGCPWALMLSSLLLLLILLLPQALSACIPNSSSPSKREPAPIVRDTNYPAFVTTILDHVNAFRTEQDARALEHDAGFAAYAAGLASQCDIESKLNGPYGDILTGGSPSIFGRDSWDGFSFNDAASDLIQGCYSANIPYSQTPPSKSSHTVAATLSSSGKPALIGYAWTPASHKFEATSAFYLRCAVSPKGNIDSQYDENVSCNGCPTSRTQQVEKAGPTDIHERQSTGSAFGDLLLAMINKIRPDAHVPPVQWDLPSAIIGKTLAKKCGGNTQGGETVGKAMVSSAPFIRTWDAKKDTINAWGAGPHITDIANYAVITDKSLTRFGCGCNDKICPGNTWYLHCFFGNWGVGTPEQTRSISECQSGGLSLDANEYSLILTTGINPIRKDAGQLDIQWSEIMTKATQELGGECNDFSVVKALSLTALWLKWSKWRAR